MILSFFWNRRQRRLRAFWRLVIQGGAYYGLLIAYGLGLGLAVSLWLLLRGGGQLSAAALLAASRSPAVVLLSQAGSFFVILLTVWLAGRFLDRRAFADFGLHLSRAWALDLGFGFVLGALLMALIFAVEAASGWLSVTAVLQPAGPGQPFLAGIALSLFAFIGVGIYEELLSRGYQLTNLAEGLNWQPLGARGAVVLAWLLSSIVFGLLHSWNPGATLVSTRNLILAGLFLGLGYVLTGELAIPIGLHIGWNLFQGNVFGFPVSGIDAGATVLAIAQRGPALWSGGAFGPEAGLVGILAMVVGSGLIVGWVRWRYGRVGLRLGLAEYEPAAASEVPRAG